MSSKPRSVTLTITSDANADYTLYLPAAYFDEENPIADRVLAKNSTDDKRRRAVLRTSIRASGNVIGVSPRTFHSLGGRGQAGLACSVSRARWWHVLRYVPGAALACAIALLSAASAAFAAWFALNDGLTHIHGDKAAFAVIALAFAVSALLAVLNLQKDLASI
jgi:hypothetical protein